MRPKKGGPGPSHVLKRPPRVGYFSIVMPLALSFAMVGMFFGCSPHRTLPSVQEGWLDLSRISLAEEDVIPLDGHWEFYYGQFVPPGSPAGGRLFAPLPGYWQDVIMDGRPLSPHGFATYRLRLLLSKEDRNTNLSLYVPHAFTAYRLFINGREVAHNGRPGRTAEEAREQFLPLAVAVPGDRQDLELVLHVSNFHSERAGFRQSIELGREQAILTRKQLRLAVDVFMTGAILSLALYHLYVYILRRREQYALHFFLYATLLSLYQMTTGEYFLILLFPDFEWKWMVILFVLSIYAGFAFLLQFVRSLYPDECSGRAVLAFQLAFLLLSLTDLAYPLAVEKSLVVGEALAVAACFYMLSVFVSALRQKRDGAAGFTLGFTVFFLTAINDVLFEKDILHTEIYAPIGVFAFILMQALTLLKRFTLVLHKVEQQEEQLRKYLAVREKMFRFRMHIRRMKLELLKKTIQPHFLMNTLVAIRAWLLEDPQQSGRLLDEFSAEMGMILRLSSRPVISLRDEIDLCRHHVRVMEIRREKAYRFCVRGIKWDESIPPLLFHTMLENAFSHADTGEGRISLFLFRQQTPSESAAPETIRYTFIVHRIGQARTPASRPGTGTGLRYVKSRLEECYPGQWSLQQIERRDRYTTIITLKAPANGGES